MKTVPVRAECGFRLIDGDFYTLVSVFAPINNTHGQYYVNYLRNSQLTMCVIIFFSTRG